MTTFSESSGLASRQPRCLPPIRQLRPHELQPNGFEPLEQVPVSRIPVRPAAVTIAVGHVDIPGGQDAMRPPVLVADEC